MCCIVQNEPNRTRHSQWWLLGDKRDEIITFNFQAKLSFLTIIDVNQSSRACLDIIYISFTNDDICGRVNSYLPILNFH